MRSNIAVVLALMLPLMTACKANQKPEAGEQPVEQPKGAENEKDTVTLDAAGQASIGLKTEEAKVLEMRSPLELTASVKPDETRTVHLKPLSRGQVRRLEVRKGDRVRTGQTLLTYDNVEVLELIGDYRSVVAALDRTTADAEQTRKSVAVYRQAVAAAGQSLEVAKKNAAAARKTAQVSRKSAEMAKKNTDVARKTADGARKTAEATQQAVDVYRQALERGKSLVDIGAVSKAEVERRSADHKNAEASNRAAEASTAIAEASTDAAEASAGVAEASISAADAAAEVAESSIGPAEAAVVSAQAAMSLAESSMAVAQSSVAVARADVDKIGARLRRLGPTDNDLERIARTSGDAPELVRTRLRALFDGVVMDVNAAEGESVEPAESLITITSISTVWVLGDVYERNLGEVHAGQEVEILTDAYPKQVFRGRVTYVSDTLDPETRTTKIRCEVANPQNLLKLEMFVRVRLNGLGVRKALAVPEKAIQTVDDKSIVFTRKEESVFVRNVVQLGANSGSMVEILDGLKEGEMVVVEGSFALKSVLLKDRIASED